MGQWSWTYRPGMPGRDERELPCQDVAQRPDDLQDVAPRWPWLGEPPQRADRESGRVA